MNKHSSYDVFVSYSQKDIAHVRDLAERLRADGLQVWLDEWEIGADDKISDKINDGLDRSKALLICISEHSATSIWRQLETQTFLWRNRSTEKKAVCVLRLDDAVIVDPLREFELIDWRPSTRTKEYPRVLAACRR